MTGLYEVVYSDADQMTQSTKPFATMHAMIDFTYKQKRRGNTILDVRYNGDCYEIKEEVRTFERVVTS